VATPLAAGYHTFGFEWDPGVVRLLIDGQQAGSLAQADVPRGSFVFRHRFYLILNLTVGGWDGTPDRTTHWPAVMKVDWVRVWR
jgi:beta-glucanase (GH16 family)